MPLIAPYSPPDAIRPEPYGSWFPPAAEGRKDPAASVVPPRSKQYAFGVELFGLRLLRIVLNDRLSLCNPERAAVGEVLERSRSAREH